MFLAHLFHDSSDGLYYFLLRLTLQWVEASNSSDKDDVFCDGFGHIFSYI
jgi:hypothetical protein